MAGKMTVFASRRLQYAIDKLSKNALIDVLVHRAIEKIGVGASDEQIASVLQEWIAAPCHNRGDRGLSLAGSIRDSLG